jgi:flagellar hook-basal body complex protein FliE
MKDITLITHLNSLGNPRSNPAGKVADGFAETLKTALNETNKAQIEADHAVEKLNTGEAKNLHEVMISMEKADISLRMLVQMRNKVVDAYQEIMRMQV